MKDLSVIKQPWITEKATALSSRGQYVFMVQPAATKNEIKKAIKEFYKVDAVRVNIVNLPRKTKRFRGVAYEKSGPKKAVVTLKPGQTIDLSR